MPARMPARMLMRMPMRMPVQILVFFHHLLQSILLSILLDKQLKIGLELITMGLLKHAARSASEMDVYTSFICNVIVGVNTEPEFQKKTIINGNGQAHEKLNAH